MTDAPVKEVVLSDKQFEALTATEPQVLFLGGIGSGKTFVGSRWIRDRAAEFPHSMHMATANSYPQLQLVVIPAIEKALLEIGITNTWKESKRKFVLPNGAEIHVASTEKYDLLRGIEIGSWWGDEIRDAPPKSVKVMLGRLRCKKVDQPRYLWTTTPNGRDPVIWQRHHNKPTPKRVTIHSPTLDNVRNLAEDYLEDRLQDFDELTARQELNAEYVNAEGLVCHAFDRDVHVCEVEYRTRETLRTCWDFNVDNLTMSMAQESPWAVRWIDQVYIRQNGSIYAACDRFLESYRNHKGDVVVHGDASGSNRDVHSGKTAYALIREKLEPVFGKRLKFELLKANPFVADRVRSWNAMLRNAKGRVRQYFDPKCARLIEDQERVMWDENGKEFDKDTDKSLTHALDGASCMVYLRHKPEVFKSEPRYRMRRAS